MKTMIVIPSSVFNWMGFAGFAGLNSLRPYYGDSHIPYGIPSEFCVESSKTGTVLTFKYAHAAYADTNMTEVANFIFEGYKPDGSLITLMIHPNR